MSAFTIHNGPTEVVVLCDTLIQAIRLSNLPNVTSASVVYYAGGRDLRIMHYEIAEALLIIQEEDLSLSSPKLESPDG